jgi:hypothetical protein
MPPSARTAVLAVVVASATACSSAPGVAPLVAPPVASDRPLDSAQLAPGSIAARTAALIEAALLQVTAADLRRCLVAFEGEGSLQSRWAGVRPEGWLIVASALPADGPAFALRHEVAPELNPAPDDGWQDRITYRTLLRSPDSADGAVACLSCVFDYDNRSVAYRQAYALDTCAGSVPGERELATMLPVR